MAKAKNGGSRVSKAKELDLSQIDPDGGTQIRETLDDAVVDEYAEALKAKAKFPPLVVFHDKEVGKHWLADGFHRFRAALKIGLKRFACEVREGTLRDAVFYATGANKGHGLRRTNEDKKNAVHRLLKDDEWGRRSDASIADHCGVDARTVANHRKELEATSEIPVFAERTGKDGKKRKARAEPVRVTRDPSADIPDAEPTYSVDDPPPGQRACCGGSDPCSCAVEEDEREAFLRDKSATIAPEGKAADVAPLKIMATCPMCHGRECDTCGGAGQIDAHAAERILSRNASDDEWDEGVELAKLHSQISCFASSWPDDRSLSPLVGTLTNWVDRLTNREKARAA